MKVPMRRASCSSFSVLPAPPLASRISASSAARAWPMAARPSLTEASRPVPWYIWAMALLLSAVRRDLRLAPPRSILGTRAWPRKICGTSSVKAAGLPALPSSWAASRLRKPEAGAAPLPPARPSSMRFWVSKWLRLASSVPAKGTKASSPRW